MVEITIELAREEKKVEDDTKKQLQADLVFMEFKVEDYTSFIKDMASPYFNDLFYDLAKREGDGECL